MDEGDDDSHHQNSTNISSFLRSSQWWWQGLSETALWTLTRPWKNCTKPQGTCASIDYLAKPAANSSEFCLPCYGIVKTSTKKHCICNSSITVCLLDLKGMTAFTPTAACCRLETFYLAGHQLSSSGLPGSRELQLDAAPNNVTLLLTREKSQRVWADSPAGSLNMYIGFDVPRVLWLVMAIGLRRRTSIIQQRYINTDEQKSI